MNKILIGLLLVAVALNTGCLATINCVKKYNSVVDEKAIQMKIAVDENGQPVARAGIDMSQASDLARGYWAAWRNEPSNMAKSTGIDALWMGAAAYASKAVYEELTDSDDSGGGSGEVSLCYC